VEQLPLLFLLGFRKKVYHLPYRSSGPNIDYMVSVQRYKSLVVQSESAGAMDLMSFGK